MTISSRSNRLCLCALFHVILVLTLQAYGQSEEYVTNGNLRGVVPFGSYQFGEIDNVNLGTGAMNLRIPLFMRTGRGLDDGRFLSYSSKIWIAHLFYDFEIPESVIGFRWFPDRFTAEAGEVQGGTLSFSVPPAVQCPDNPFVYIWVHSNFVYRSPDGAQYRFPNRDYYLTGGAYCDHSPVDVTDRPIGLSDSGTMQLDTSGSTYVVRFKGGRTQSFYPNPRQTRDTNGNLVDDNGDTLKRVYGCQYNEAGQITHITVPDSDGTPRTFTLEYTILNFGTAFPASSCGTQWVQQYTASFSVISRLVLPNGRAFVFSYNPPAGQTAFGEITRIDLPVGGYIRYEYATLPEFDEGPGGWNCRLDSRRVAKRIVSPDGATEQVWQYGYERLTSPDRYRTTVTDPMGNVSYHTFDIDGIHELETEIRQGGSTILRKVVNTWAKDLGPTQTDQYNVSDFDERNWRISASTTTDYPTNHMRRVETDYDAYTYDFPLIGSLTDSRMNVVETREYDFGVGSWGPLMRRTAFSYLHQSNANYLSRHIWDRPTLRTIYDGSGNLKAQTIFAYDTTPITATSGTVQHDYVNFPSSMPYRGNLTERHDWLNTAGAWMQTYHWYDDLGNVIQTKDPKTNNTHFSYADSWSNSACAPAGPARAFPTQTTNALDHISRSSYYSCTSLKASDTDANNQTTSYSYEEMDRILQVVRPDSSQTSYGYNDAARTIGISGDLNTPNDNVLQSAILYDGLGRTIETRTSEGTGFISIQYVLDAYGRTTGVSNPYRPASEPLVWTTTSYDALGRVWQVVYPDGAVETIQYAGNEALATDPAFKKRESITDALGRLTGVTEDPTGLAFLTTYQYDALDNLTSVQQGGQTRGFAYDSLGRLTGAANPESGAVSYHYDYNGNLTQKTDARGTITYTYDNLNRLTSRSYTDGTAMVTFGYDAPGVTNSKERLTSVTSNVSSYGYDEYDVMGRVKRSSQATGGNQYLFSYNYNLAGGLTAQTYPSGRTVNQHYDVAGRVDIVTGSQPSRTYAPSISYAAHGAVKVMQLGNGLWEHANFNSRIQPWEIGLGISSTSTSVLGLAYEYGTGTNNGNIMSQTVAVQGWSRTQSYTYDGLNRLEQAVESGSWTQGYGYDRYGNRWVTAGSYLPNGTLTPQSQAAFNPANNRLAASQYDTSGNQVQDAAGRNFGYDLENRQTSFNGGSVTYAYDGEGRRVKKTEAAGTTIFVYDAFGRLAAEYGNIVPAEPSGMSYLTADHLGSTRVITDAAGAVKKRYDYLPFGEEIESTVGNRWLVAGYGTSDATRQRFSGKERDAESGLDYFGARYFSGAQGRFTSTDPLPGWQDDPQSWNMYAYGRNNPLRYMDPDGKRYRICDSEGKNCAEISDEEYRDWWKTAEKNFYQAGGKIYQRDVEGLNPLGTVTYMGSDQLFALAKGAELAGPTVNAMGVATLAFVGGAAATGTAAILTGVGRVATLELVTGAPLATQVIFRAQQLDHAMRVASGHNTPLGAAAEIKAAVEAAVNARQYAVGAGGVVRGVAVIRGVVHEFTGFLTSAGRIIFSNIYRK